MTPLNATSTWGNVHDWLIRLSKKLKALLKRFSSFQALVPNFLAEWVELVNKIITKCGAVPAALHHESQHQVGVLKALRQVAKGLKEVLTGCRKVLDKLKATDQGCSSTDVQQAAKQLQACWSVWQRSADAKLRLLAGIAAVEPGAAVAKAKAAAPVTLPVRSAGSQLLGSLVSTAAERAARAARFAQRSTFPSCQALDDVPEDSAQLLATRGAPTYGTSKALEKSYLRLPPGMVACMQDVRPPAVLSDALRHVQLRWRDEGVTYEWVCDQLKAIRQDLVVQNVRGDVALRTYEFHARVALECGDRASYHQCQGMLKPLHMASGFKGDTCMEFASYRLMHAAMSSVAEQISEMQCLPEHAIQHDYVVHALKVCRAFHQQQWVSFGSLYDCAPRMSPYLMDMMLSRLRVSCLRSILLAFRPSLPAEEVGWWLGFDMQQQDDVEAASEFLRDRGCVLHDGDGRCHDVGPGVTIDCKLSLQALK